MEEAEKRRERLRSMRMGMEASAAAAASDDSTTINLSTPLSNPLLLDEQPQQGSAVNRPRFDFYTDPLAAFSSSNKHIHIPHLSSSAAAASASGSPTGYSEMSHFHAPNQNIPYYTSNSTPTPTPFRTPFPLHQATPNFSSPPYAPPPLHISPNPGLRPGGSPYPGYQGSPNIVPHTQGTGPWPNRCPSPSYGRGSGQWDGGRMTPDSRYSGGRGRGRAFDAHGRSYYDRSMVEDPWNSLTPVIWQADDEPDFFNSWGPLKIAFSVKSNRGSVRLSSSSKKPRVSKTMDNEPSLAEFLAAAADGADEDDTGAGTM